MFSASRKRYSVLGLFLLTLLLLIAGSGKTNAFAQAPNRIAKTTMIVPLAPDANASIAADCYVSSWNGNVAQCGQNHFYVGYNTFYGKGQTRSFLKFNLPSKPANSYVSSARLRLYSYAWQSSNNYIVDVYRVTSNWSNPTWNSQPSVNGTIRGSATVTKGTVKYFYWTITSLVKDWYGGTANYGMMLRGRNENEYGNTFRSRENVGYAPVIEITFSSLPSTPTLYAISNSGGSSSFTVDWANAANATSYTLQEQFNGGSWSTVYSGGTSQTGRSGRSAGTWCYRVRGNNAGGSSSWSGTTCTTVKPGAPSLSAISNGDGDGTFTVSWTAASGASGYELQELPAGGAWTTIYSGGSTSHDLTNRTSGTWQYRVRASNAGGSSAWSTIQSTTVKPDAPTLFPISNGDGDGSYSLLWNAVTGASSYTLQRANEATFSSPTTIYSGSVISASVSGEASGTWYYRVKATNGGGSSPWSNIESTTIRPATPTISPIDNYDRDGNYTIFWSPTAWTDTYTLERSDNVAFNSPVTIYNGSDTSTLVSEQAAGTWYYRVNASNAGGSSLWSNQVSATVDPPPSSDDHEPDNSCNQATGIATNGTVQIHTFHTDSDVDWVNFDVTSGQTYLIETQIPPNSPANVAIRIYNQCSGSLIATQGHSFNPGVRLEFVAPSNDPVYIELLNEDTEYGEHVAYHLSVREQANTFTPGAVIIVGGRLKQNDALQDNIYNIADRVYQMFLGQGYGSNRLHYLAPDLTRDPSEDGRSDVAASATRANLQAAITTWAVNKVGPERALTLFLVDHGDHNKIYLDKLNGEWLEPQELDAWLSQLEEAAPGVRINIIIEACRSGSFIAPTFNVSAPGRVVISSTGVWNPAFVTNDGAVFSDHFITALSQEESLYNSFQTALWATTQDRRGQTPWIDADGDGIPNEEDDQQIAAQRGFGYASTLGAEEWSPHIEKTTPLQIENGQGMIQVKAQDDEIVQIVWAVIYPPSYQPPVVGEELSQETLTIVELEAQANGVYSANYTNFDEIGEYRIVIHAQDNAGFLARPLSIEVQNGWQLFLPFMRR